MLAFDRMKIIAWSPYSFLAKNTAAPFAQLRGITMGYDSGAGEYIGTSHSLGQYGNGCCANCKGSGLSGITDSMSAIAAFDPEPISSTAFQVAATASKVINQIEAFFGIGAGRREADQIVPVQNDLHLNVIKPIYDVLELADKSSVSCQSLATMYQSAYAAQQKWLDFLHNTQWSDGRAAVQAENTLAPYWTTILGNPGAPGGLEQIFNNKQCGVWKQPVIPGAQATITVQPGAGYSYPSLFSSDFGNVLTQYGPYILAGFGALLLSRASKRW